MLNQVKAMRGPDETAQRLLVGVGSGPVSENLLRWTQAQAESLKCSWIAVYIELPLRLSKAEQERLDGNLVLARELGAEVITSRDEDVARGLIRVAVQQQITQIIVGKEVGEPPWRFFQSDALLRRLVRESGKIAVQIVRIDLGAKAGGFRVWRTQSESTWREYLTAVLVIGGITLAALFVNPVAGYRAIAFVYLLAVVLMASFVGRGPTLLAAMISALLWDFFFEAPLYSLRISSFEDQILFVTYIVVALVLGQLTARIRAQEKAERQLGERATALYLLNQELTVSTDLDQILQPAIRHLQRTFDAEAAVLLPDLSNRLELHGDSAARLKMNQVELSVADWVFEHGRPAGKFTENLPQSEVMFLPLKGSHSVLGVVGLRLIQPLPPPLHQRNLLDAFLQQIALAIDRLKMREVLEQSRLLAESEHLSKTLLNSISHEIRTPLAVIEAAGSNLVGLEKTDLSPSQRSMVSEIREATERLNRLVGNVLDITRLESGHVRPKLDFHDVGELIRGALAESSKTLAGHKVTVQIEPEVPFVWMDLALMHQVVMNLLANAAFHTPPGTQVEVTARLDGKEVVLAVEDRGPGINPAFIPHLFEKFYRAPDAPTGGTGLGLSIVKGFVEAQGGSVKVENRTGGGLAFTIRLPLDKGPAMPDDVGAHFSKPANSQLCV